MPLQRFEAPTLEAALAMAHSAVGASARVVDANRLRKGGLAGFFAKERYELTVEADGQAAPTALSMPRSAASVAPASASPLAASPPPPAVHLAPADRPATTPRSILDLADAASDADELVLHQLSTGGSPFAELVARLAAEHDPEPERLAVARPSVEPASFENVPIARPVAASSAPAAVSSLSAPVSPTNIATSFAGVGLPAELALDLTLEPAHALLSALASAPTAPPLALTSGAVLAVVGRRDDALGTARALAEELGLDPADVLLAASDDGGTDLWPGTLLPSAPAVAEARWAARFKDRPTVVAVSSTVACNGAAWGRRALEALDPTTTWAVVDAATKAEDVVVWTEQLGGVDALVVRELDATASPATVLATGIPVVRLGDRPASPALWTALLLERVAR